MALAAPLVNAMLVTGDLHVEVKGNTAHFRRGQFITDPNFIKVALAAAVPYVIPGPIVIGAVAGGFEGDQITIGGTPTTADTVNVTINGHALGAAYSPTTGDSQASVADGVARLINLDATDNAIVSASAEGNVVQITELVKGASHTVTAAATGGHTTATVATAGTGGFTVVVQGQEVEFAVGQVITDPSMIGVVAQNLIPYTLQAGVKGFVV
jgi:hypothetical protein